MSEPAESAQKACSGLCAPAAYPAKLSDQLQPAILSVVVLTLLTGCAFPLLLFAIARPLFPHQTGGSLVTRDGGVIGSELIGQEFTGPEYFQSRPSAAGSGYDGTSSGATHLSPDNPKLVNGARGFPGIGQLAEEYRQTNGLAPDTRLEAINVPGFEGVARILSEIRSPGLRCGAVDRGKQNQVASRIVDGSTADRGCEKIIVEPNALIGHEAKKVLRWPG
jgi:K+-transporting ATPase, c chain